MLKVFSRACGSRKTTSGVGADIAVALRRQSPVLSELPQLEPLSFWPHRFITFLGSENGHTLFHSLERLLSQPTNQTGRSPNGLDQTVQCPSHERTRVKRSVGDRQKFWLVADTVQSCSAFISVGPLRPQWHGDTILRSYYYISD